MRPNYRRGELMKTAPGFQASEMFDQYRQLSDDELEYLLEDFDSLLAPAQSCLVAELRTRGQTDETIAAIIDAGKKHKLPLVSIDGFDPDLTRKIGSVTNIRGIGRIFYGKTNFTYNELFAFEEYDTTLWWIFSFIPVISRGSFRIRRKRQRMDDPPRTFSSYAFVVVQQIPFLWRENVIRMALSVALFLLFGFMLVPAIFSR
jgi:hypothetical protein